MFMCLCVYRTIAGQSIFWQSMEVKETFQRMGARVDKQNAGDTLETP